MWFKHHPLGAVILALALVAAGTWGWKLLALQRSVSHNAEYWSQPRGEKGGLLYVALGDSAAQGIGASSPQHGYVSLLAARLRQATGKPVEVVNLSRSGARIDDVLDRQLQAMAALGRKPDVITVAIGGNDLRAYDRSFFATQVDQLTRSLPTGAFVADAPYFMHGHWERNAENAAMDIRRSAREQGLRPVALHEALRAQGSRAMLTQFAADWFHPNDNGHKVWTDAFWAELSRQLPRSSS